jgi:hypothetical protein
VDYTVYDVHHRHNKTPWGGGYGAFVGCHHSMIASCLREYSMLSTMGYGICLRKFLLEILSGET